MNTYDMLIQVGEKKGIQKAIQALLKRGESVASIAETFEVSVEMVKKIKAEMQANDELPRI